MENQWTEESYTALILLYAATFDMGIDQDEEAVIQEVIGEDAYKQARECFDQCSDADIIDLILEHKDKWLAVESQRQAVFGKMRQVFQADHKYSQVEKQLIQLLKKML